MTEKQGPVARVKFEPIRDVFRDEARHFTTWLEQNLEALADRLGITLSVVQREKAVGDFNVDLLCEDEDGRPVIIENQLERTNHEHLGKLLTYLVNLEAGSAIWVTPESRPEHQRVIDWLNENTPANLSFYLVKVEAARISDSPPAPLFTVLAGPSEQGKEVGEKKKEWADRHLKRLEFWKGLLERSKKRVPLFASISPSTANWIAAGAGKRGVTFNYDIFMEGAALDLYIDHDQDTGAKNKAIFDALLADKENIERDVGTPLLWQRLDAKRASRIRLSIDSGGLSYPESWPSLQDRMVDAMTRFEPALRSRLAKIEV